MLLYLKFSVTQNSLLSANLLDLSLLKANIETSTPVGSGGFFVSLEIMDSWSNCLRGVAELTCVCGPVS